MIIGKGAATMKIYSFIRKNGYKQLAAFLGLCIENYFSHYFPTFYVEEHP